MTGETAPGPSPVRRDATPAQRAALDFLETCVSEPDVDIVVALFLRTIKAFGFDVAAAGAWVGVGATRSNRFYFNNWPEAWVERYNAGHFFSNDPMMLETLRRMTPFLWSEMTGARTFTVEGAAVVAAGKAYGWSEVMGVPIHGPASYQGLVTMAAFDPPSMDPIAKSLLRAMAVAVHDRVHVPGGPGQTAPATAALTAREVECMRWVAVGKTDAEIAIILTIAATTVHYHVERVKRKLATHSRTEAVALMVLSGSI